MFRRAPGCARRTSWDAGRRRRGQRSLRSSTSLTARSDIELAPSAPFGTDLLRLTAARRRKAGAWALSLVADHDRVSEERLPIGVINDETPDLLQPRSP